MSLMRTAVIFFAVRAGWLAERTGEDTRKGLLRIEAVLQADIVHFLVGIT